MWCRENHIHKYYIKQSIYHSVEVLFVLRHLLPELSAINLSRLVLKSLFNARSSTILKCQPKYGLIKKFWDLHTCNIAKIYRQDPKFLPISHSNKLI